MLKAKTTDICLDRAPRDCFIVAQQLISVQKCSDEGQPLLSETAEQCDHNPLAIYGLSG